MPLRINALSGASRSDAQYYPVARLVHLERMSAGAAADLIYSRHRLDWNDALATSTPGVYRKSFMSAVAHFWRTDYRCIEIPEPLAIPILPHALAVSATIALKRLLRRQRTELTFYAIENLDQAAKLAHATHIPYWLARGVIRFAAGMVVRSSSRVAYGTEGARDNYLRAIGGATRGGRGPLARVFEALPSPDTEPVIAKDPEVAIFLGSFETRKGIERILAAWPSVRAVRPNARLLILGHGALQDDVVSWAEGRPDGEVDLRIDPPRAVIRECLRRAHCLVLPSARTPTWQEQVGLPIVEALQQGCEIVTTDETGIAQWLGQHGHEVLGAGWTNAHLATAIDRALAKSRSATVVQDDLPSQDSRLAAELWMFDLGPARQ